ncbi:hypothetical protein [Acetanaerobacterium elongatum]|uniref:Uncharacterized protein n=1 Tax=Acetanaerobacterium elongatum TaxID=258515 RepID=A0A1H0H669_9FIRM|nr:hypothetical protein [Acetanaerobacterium elongatum]SDO14638.1 hypothetical protein SAMN05192585_1623 [Acetanaerobacterium elongatum]
MESKTLKRWSLICFIAALPALIVTDWYLKGFGLLVLFILLAAGLIFDQLARIYYPAYTVDNPAAFRRHRLLQLYTLILFLMSPMAVVYGNRLNLAFGVTAAALMIGLGLVLDQVARSRYRYHKIEQRGEGQTI